MTRDKIKLIWIASLGSNSMSKKGVAMIEKPNPVLVCKIEATKIIDKNPKNVTKSYTCFKLKLTCDSFSVNNNTKVKMARFKAKNEFRKHLI